MKNENLYRQELSTLAYLVNEWKNELKRTTTDVYSGTTYKTVRKERLKRLRLEINTLLMKVEKEYECHWEEV
jgi:hypothetical protein